MQIAFQFSSMPLVILEIHMWHTFPDMHLYKEHLNTLDPAATSLSTDHLFSIKPAWKRK